MAGHPPRYAPLCSDQGRHDVDRRSVPPPAQNLGAGQAGPIRASLTRRSGKAAAATTKTQECRTAKSAHGIDLVTCRSLARYGHARRAAECWLSGEKRKSTSHCFSISIYKYADGRPLRRWILRSRGRLLRSENRNEQEGSRQGRGRAQGRNRDRARRNKVGENSTCSPRWTGAVCRLSNHDAGTRCHTNRTAQGSSIASDRQFRSRRVTPSGSRLRPSWQWHFNNAGLLKTDF